MSWWGWAAGYQSATVHVVVLCLKSRRCLISLIVTATPAAFAAREELYRWLMQWQIFIDKVPNEADLASATRRRRRRRPAKSHTLLGELKAAGRCRGIC